MLILKYILFEFNFILYDVNPFKYNDILENSLFPNKKLRNFASKFIDYV